MEDLDLLGFYVGDTYKFRSKTSRDNFSWSDLKQPFQRFFEVLQLDANCKFLLVCGGSISRAVSNLSRRESLSGKDRKRLNNNIADLLKSIGISRAQGESLLKNLLVVSKPEADVYNELRKLVAEQFRLGSEAVDIHIATLVFRFFNWAGDRREVRRADVEGVRAEVGEALARENAFQAYGRGLVTRLLWEPDASESDFFEGKQTRAGHIALGLDVGRPLWLQEIDRKLTISSCCVILSSSGQGKSTLLYRYAREQRILENPFVLKVAETYEQVEQVLNYLRFWNGLTVSSLLLIDNAGRQTRLWPLVAQGCAEMGMRVTSFFPPRRLVPIPKRRPDRL